MDREMTLVANEDYYDKLPVTVRFFSDLPDPFSITQPTEVGSEENDFIILTGSQARALATWIMEKLDGQ